MHAVRSVYISSRYTQQKYRTVLLAIVCAALRLYGRYAARVVVIYIFEHLHTSTVMFYKYASLRLHDSNATGASTPQEYSVMHSVCFFSACVCPNKHLTRMLFHLTTREGVQL